MTLPRAPRSLFRLVHSSGTPRRRLRRSSIGVLATALVAGAIGTVGGASGASAAAQVVAEDAFPQASSVGWADAAVGGAYSYTSSRGVSATPGGGVMDLTKPGEGRDVFLPAVSASDVTVSTTSRVSTMPTSGSGVRYAVTARGDGKASYDALVRTLPTGGTLLSLGRINSAGVRTRLSSDIVVASTASPQARLRLTLTVKGSSSVQLTADATVEDGARTSSRSVKAIDSSSSRIAQPGHVGVSSYLSVDSPRAAITVTSLRAVAEPVAPPPAANKAPNASFTSVVKRKGLEAAFDGSASADPDGSVTSYAWTLGDGSTANGAVVEHRYSRPGSYTVTLVVTDDRGATHKTSRIVTVTAPNQPPTATFTATQKAQTISLDAGRSSDADGRVMDHAWDFGDGQTATGARVSHDYLDGGRYTVTLTVTDDDGATATTTRTFAVVAPNRAPLAAFDAQTARKGLTATFDAGASSDPDGSISAYRWDFGDRSTAAGRNATRTYAKPGAYLVTLTVTDDRGATTTTSRTVTVAAPNRTPDATFTADATHLDLAVDASGSRDADGSIESYAWDFGDGGSATGRTGRHSYAAAGRYVVTLTVVDDDGAKATSTTTVVVTAKPVNKAPIAAFTSTTTDLAGHFDASTSSDPDGDVTGYSWNFGDGTTGYGAVVRHTYDRAGEYRVTLTVTDDQGAVATETRQHRAIAPNAAPLAAFTAATDGLGVALDATGSRDEDGSVVSYAWAFGDGDNATGRTVEHRYGKTGSYVVTLTVFDDDGARSTATRVVDVTAPVVPTPGVKPSAATTGVPAGVRLTRHDGNLTVTKAGTVIDSLDVYGNVFVKAPNVTIRNSRVRGQAVGYAVGLITNYGYANLVVEDTYISPDAPSVTLDGVKGSDYTLRRVHVVGGVDSAKVQGDNVRIEDSLLENTNYFLSDPYQNNGPTHSDNVQIQKGRNIVVTGNTIRGAQNFAVLGAASIGDTPGLKVTGNWVNDGHCTMKFEQYQSWKLSVLVKDNKFGPDRKVRSCPMVATPDVDFTPDNNVWESGGGLVSWLRVANK